jgi:SAM-dependent methyltransferase
MEWVRGFYERQYAWSDWRSRWADLDLADPTITAHVAAVRRMCGPGEKRILELGSGLGTVAAALAHAGHDVIAIDLIDDVVQNTQRLAADVRTGSLQAIAGDFYEITLESRFDVVAYFDGFGIGTDDDQHRLLRRIAGWVAFEGCVLIDVFTPCYWTKSAGTKEEFPNGSGVWYLDRFDAEGSRMVEEMWRDGDEDSVVQQSLRCYAPVDLQLLIAGTGLELSMVEPYRDESYERACPLDEAMLYLAKLVPTPDLEHS